MCEISDVELEEILTRVRACVGRGDVTFDFGGEVERSKNRKFIHDYADLNEDRRLEIIGELTSDDFDKAQIGTMEPFKGRTLYCFIVSRELRMAEEYYSVKYGGKAVEESGFGPEVTEDGSVVVADSDIITEDFWKRGDNATGTAANSSKINLSKGDSLLGRTVGIYIRVCFLKPEPAGAERLNVISFHQTKTRRSKNLKKKDKAEDAT